MERMLSSFRIPLCPSADSNLVITYSNLLRNRETSFLHSLPMDPNTIFVKFWNPL